jgi:hypothetical protein
MNEALAYSLLFNLILLYLVVSLYGRIKSMQIKLNDIHKMTAPSKKPVAKPVDPYKKIKWKIYE